MKRFKHAILPLLTVLIVLGTIILPGQISVWKDGVLMNRVHREDCIIDMALPNYAHSMEERIELYVREQSQEEISVMTQSLMEEELDDLEEMVRQELAVFQENGFFPEEAYEELLQITVPRGEHRYGTRLYLQDQKTRAATRVVICEEISTKSDMHLWMTMDEETGRILSFDFTLPDLELQRTPHEFAEFFMNRLGVPHEESWASEDGYAVEMTIPEHDVTFNFNFQNANLIQCEPYDSGFEKSDECSY